MSRDDRGLFPKEILVPVDAGGRRWWAGANFAWLARNHFTVVSDRHEGQVHGSGVLAAMAAIHSDTGGAFRIIFNGSGAGASIPWHLHLQMTTEPFPVEAIQRGAEGRYPLPMVRFDDAVEAVSFIRRWEDTDRSHRRVNLLVAGPQGRPGVFVFLCDARFPASSEKGLMASFEASGDFVFDGVAVPAGIRGADLAMVHRVFGEIRCHDSVDSDFSVQTYTTDASGGVAEPLLCYSSDGPDHWVTVGEVNSNHVSW